MERDVVILKYKQCGEDFLYDYRGSGRKPSYCEKCRENIDTLYKRNYRAKKRAERKELKKVEKPQVTIERIETDFSVDEYSQFTQKISELLMKLDTTRVELCNVAKQMSDYQSGYDKNDQAFLHKLEDFDTVDYANAVKFLTEWKTSRKNRRNMKDLISLVGNTINSIPYKSYANALPILKGTAYKE